MNIFNRLATKKIESQTTARERYLALLAKIDLNNPSDSDANDLESLLNELGIAHDRAASDHAIVAKALSEHAVEARFDELAAAISPAAEKFLAACKARQDAFHKHNESMRVAREQEEQARADHARSQDARSYLFNLAQDDPMLATIVGDFFASSRNKKQKAK